MSLPSSLKLTLLPSVIFAFYFCPNTIHLSSEGTLLVDVVSYTGLSWSLEAESRVAHEPGGKRCSNVSPGVVKAQEVMSTWARWA